MEFMPRHLRAALQLLARSPGFAATVIVTLALGIGADGARLRLLGSLLYGVAPYDPMSYAAAAAVLLAACALAATLPAARAARVDPMTTLRGD